MRTNQLLSVLLVLVILLLSACRTSPEPAAVEVTCDDFARAVDPASARASIAREITVPLGTPVELTLCSNPGTGYSWEVAKIEDAAIVQQVDHQVEASESRVPGAPGTETWTFKTTQAGTTTVSLDYSRPWVGGEKGTWRFVLTVTVR